MTSAYPAFHMQEDPLRIFESRAARTVLFLAERVARDPHVCVACSDPIPAPSVYVAATCGGKKTRFTVHLHPACVPSAWGRVPPINPMLAWRAAKRAILAAKRPTDVPAWVASMLIPF